MNNEIIISEQLVRVESLMPVNPVENTLYRMQPFIEWCNDTLSGNQWLIPDLQAYGDHLSQRMQNKSIRAHLGTIRAQYRKLIKNNDFRRLLIAEIGVDGVNEWVVQLNNALDPGAVSFPVVTNQDEETRVRLSGEQVTELLSQIDTSSLRGLRDSALVRLLLATGIREAECADLVRSDLFQEYEGLDAVYIRKGKGNKSRKIPIQGMSSFLMPVLSKWLLQSANTDAVFKKVNRGDNVGTRPLNKRSIEYVLSRYPVTHRGELYVVKPHDLRATYARSAYQSGVPIEAIAKNMGHSDTKTTLGYIGDVGAQLRNVKIDYGE